MKVYLIASFVFGLLSVCVSEDLSAEIWPAAFQNTDNTTTEINNTTEHVSTTTETSTITTETPTITTETPTTTTETPTVTTETPTTTMITTTTAPPVTPPGGGKLESGTWKVTDKNNITCIILRAEIQFQITYEQKNGTLNKTNLNVPKTANSELSSCEQNTIALMFGNNTFTLTFVKDEKKVHVKQAKISYFVDKEMFPDAVNLDSEVHETKDNLTLFEVSEGKSYLCKAGAKIDFNNVTTVALTDVQVEAFKNNTQTDFSSSEECSGDEKISDIVPIAVGCALAALVIIVLIAYLVGRQRNRQRGYQSV